MNFQPKSLDEFLESGFFKVLAEPARLKLIQLLWKTGRASVGALAEGMTQDRSVVSRHLQALKAADLVTSEKVGRHFYYELKPDQLVMKLEFLAETVKAQFNDRCC